MDYCGIDLAGVSSYVYVTDERGRKLTAGAVATEKRALERRLKGFVPGGLSIAIEAGNQTAWVYEALVEMGAKVTVVNPTKVKLIAESRRKTDKIDAKILCELLRLDGLPCPVHVPDRKTRALRGLLVARRQLVSARTKLCNVVRGMLRQEGVRLPARALSSFVGWRRVLAQGFQQAHLPVVVATYFDTFVSLTDSIRDLEGELAEYERADQRAARLQTMPKVGRIAALTFLAAVDDVARFPSSRKLVGYSGLAPTVRSSGERTEYGSISRQGRRELRAVWVQIAHLVAIDTSRATRPLRTWFNKVARRRGKKTATVALARRLLVIAYHLLREEAVYDPARLKRAA
ncbi:MAG: IS110 family RNA-guided transposase [Planctomycetota bacterium]